MRVERSTEYRIVVSEEELDLLGLTMQRVLNYVQGTGGNPNAELSKFNSRDVMTLRDLANGIAGVHR